MHDHDGRMDGIHDDGLRQDRGQLMTAYMTLTVALDIRVARIRRIGVYFQFLANELLPVHLVTRAWRIYYLVLVTTDFSRIQKY